MAVWTQWAFLLVSQLLAASGSTENCNVLRILAYDLSPTNATLTVNEGRLLTLVCDGTCQGVGFPPALTWFTPDGERVSSFPGRSMAVFGASRRQLRLHVQNFRRADAGEFLCRGWVKGVWRTASIKVTAAVTHDTRAQQRGNYFASKEEREMADSQLPALPEARIARR